MFLGFITGILGSLHCAGMCGAIALSIPQKNIVSIILYNLGRIFTYSILGVFFGWIGKGISITFFQQYLSILMGATIIILVIFRSQIEKLVAKNTWMASIKTYFSRFLGKKDGFSRLMIGVLNGLLPCGLVYVALAGATAMADALSGGFYMALFGIGTSPIMASLMLSPRVLKAEGRIRMAKGVTAMTLLVGVLLMFRGLDLGIPYLSPKIEAKTKGKNFECCSKIP
ncbi:MAG: sulfite exporter TauE/SafE family protein [Flammeovirgaceae bacterium]